MGRVLGAGLGLLQDAAKARDRSGVASLPTLSQSVAISGRLRSSKA